MQHTYSLIKLTVIWLVALILLTHCGRPARSKVTVAPVDSFPQTTVPPLPSTSPSPSPSPIIEPVDNRAAYFFNSVLPREAQISLLSAVGLGPFLVHEQQTADAQQIYQCQRAGVSSALRLTRDPSQCAAIGASPSPAFWIRQSPSNQAQHVLRVCYSPFRDLFYTKLGGNPCNAIPGLNPAFTDTWKDASEAEVIGFASTTGYTLQ